MAERSFKIKGEKVSGTKIEDNPGRLKAAEFKVQDRYLECTKGWKVKSTKLACSTFLLYTLRDKYFPFSLSSTSFTPPSS